MRVAVLGAGLQGACVAMELADAGVQVDLYDKADACVTQASAQNEGKIHLGYVFANDPSLDTARAMVRGALCFERLLRRWLGSDVDTIPVSSPFYYAVDRRSLLSIEQVAAHLAASHEFARTQTGTVPRAYFGSDYLMAPERLSPTECDAMFDRRTVAGGFRTAEIALDPEAMARVVRSRLESDTRIRCRLGTQVHAVEATTRGLTVRSHVDGHSESQPYDHVVNALWDGRLVVDRSIGLAPDRPWLFRIKHYLRVRAPALDVEVPSTTIVLGPFGDVVAYGEDLYLSWYPAGMQGMSSELAPPPWPPVLDEHQAKELWHDILAGLTPILPALGHLTMSSVESWSSRGGIIFAWGQTDIDDPSSGLHRRCAIGPRTHGNYHSIDTGKLTMAPLFGKAVADRILQIGRSAR